MHRSKSISRSPFRALIADDYPDTAESLGILLSAAAFDVQIARDGADAMSRAHSWQPDVCILDLNMPRFDGLEIAAWIHRQIWDRQRPVLIALTGWGRPEDQIRAKDAGFEHYFLKPADPNALVRVIQAALARRRVLGDGLTATLDRKRRDHDADDHALQHIAGAVHEIEDPWPSKVSTRQDRGSQNSMPYGYEATVSRSADD